MIEQHVFAGITFPGRHEVKRVAQELQRQKLARKDAVVRSDRMEVRVLDNQMLLDVPYKGEKLIVPMTNNSWNQLLGWMGLEKRSGYYKWLMHGRRSLPKRVSDRRKMDVRKHWENARLVFNDFMKTEKAHRLVRMMDTKEGDTYVRAFLSDKFRIVPNDSFFEAIVDRLLEANAEIWHARLSEDRFMVYAVAPGLSAQINTTRTFDPGDGFKARWFGEKGDAYNAALTAWNSETGCGGYGISQAVVRRADASYHIWRDIVAKSHVGRRRGDEELLSDETIKKENEVFFLKIRDYVENTFDRDAFQKIVDAINGATKDPVPPEKAEEVADAMQVTYELPEERAARIKQLFYQGGDYSRHGLADAVAKSAGDGSVNPDVGSDMERTAAEIMQTPVLSILARGEKLKKAKDAKREAEVFAAASNKDGFFDE